MKHLDLNKTNDHDELIEYVKSNDAESDLDELLIVLFERFINKIVTLYQPNIDEQMPKTYFDFIESLTADDLRKIGIKEESINVFNESTTEDKTKIVELQDLYVIFRLFEQKKIDSSKTARHYSIIPDSKGVKALASELKRECLELIKQDKNNIKIIDNTLK